MHSLKHLLLVQILLVHEVSNLFVMMLEHLHRLIVDVLLQLRVLARIVDVVRVMMMNRGIIRDRQGVCALMSHRRGPKHDAYDQHPPPFCRRVLALLAQ